MGNDNGIFYLYVVIAVCIILLLFSGESKAGEPFVEVGIAFHDEAISAPEVMLPGTLSIVRGGYAVPLNKQEKVELNLFVEHVSSIQLKEKGYGLNMAGASLRFNFK